jgi:hypothetical protein
MSLQRLGIAAAAAAPALAAGWLLAPAGAQSQASPTTAIPCGISWEDTTHGGDWFTVKGDAMFSQVAPQAGGSFVAIGYGQATVTFHPGNNCQVTSGNTFTAQYMVTMESDDGRKAQVDISSGDDSHEFKLLCPGLIQGRGATRLAETSSDYDPPGLPTVTVDLGKEGAQPFSQNFQGDRRGSAGDEGTVTLHYCPPGQPNAR